MHIEVWAPGGPVEGDVVVIPGDLATPPPAEALRAFTRAGGKLLGLGDGVASLCAAGLLPGGVTADAPTASPTHVRVEGRATPFTWAIPAGRIVALAAVTARHRYAADAAEVTALGARGQIVLRYCDGEGGVPAGAHAATVAGVCDETGHVVGLLAPTASALACALGRQLLACLERR